MSSPLDGRDLFLRHTNADGTTFVTSHRVWGDGQDFVRARQAEASKLALEPIQKGQQPGKNKAEQITAKQYAAERKK